MNENDRMDADLEELLSDDTIWAEPRPDGADALLAAIRSDTGEGPRRLDPVPRHRQVPDRRPGRRWRPALVAAAAAAVVLVAGAVVGVRLGDDDGQAREVALAGSELAPNARGTATVEEVGSGVAIEIDVTGLPPAAPGTYYQAWVRGPDGLITIGTFHMRGGDDTVELWSGVELDRYPLLTVTLQQEGAGQDSSGQVVLSGEIGS